MILTYQGQEIQQRELDGYVNLTQMAKANGVEVRDWVRLESTKEYILALESDVQICTSELLIINKGGISSKQGTWAHPLLALNFGRWINPKFAIWCDKHIKTLLETGKTEIIQVPKRAITYYADRVMDIDKNLIKPKDTWCVIEKCAHLLLRVEKIGYQINQFDLLDLSVGKRWLSYRKDKDWACEISKATYKFNDVRGERIINAYEYPEIGYFMTWLDSTYQTKHLPKYLKEKYGNLVKV